MINVSSDLAESLSSDVQIVRPNVKAWMTDLRNIENLKVYSSSHTMNKQISDRSPLMHLKLDKTEFNSFPINIADSVAFTGTPATFYLAVPSLVAGTAIVITDRNVITSVSVGSTYYIQNPNPSTGKFSLNTDRTNAINNSATGRINFSGSTKGSISYNYFLDSVKDYGSSKLNFSPGSSYAAPGPAGDLNFDSFYMTEKSKEIIEPKYLIHTFWNNYATSLGPFSTAYDADSDLHYYSFRFSPGTKWYASGGNAHWFNSPARYNTVPVYFFMDSKCLDHFVDFRIGSGGFDGGQGALLRYIDDANYIYCRQTRTGGGTDLNTAAIYKVINNVHTMVTSIDTLRFGSSKWYRFEAKYNTFTVYDLGSASIPTKDSVGTVMTDGTKTLTCYIDDAIFRSKEATGVGLINASTSGYNPGYVAGGATFSFSYFATYGFNYLTAGQKFTEDGYLIADTTYLGNSLAQYQPINNAENFTYSFLLKKSASGSGSRQTVFWFGDSSSNTALRISYTLSTSKLRVSMIDTSNNTYLLNSSTTIVNNTFYNIQVVKNGTFIYLYINGSLDATLNTGVNFLLKNASSSTPIIMIGGDYAKTNLGDNASAHLLNGYISEIAMYDFAFTQNDVDAFYGCIDNNATLYADTSDHYFNAECAVDGQLEETLTFAFTNMLSVTGEEIRVNSQLYCPNGVDSISLENDIEDNYGWMSRVESDSSGDFSAYDFLHLSFDQITCNRIMISTGFSLGAVDTFDYYASGPSGVVASGTSLSFGGDSIKYIELGGDYAVTDIRVTPKSTVNPIDYARIFAINPIWEVDLSDYVISFSVDKVRENFDASLPIGATAANNGSITLDNTSQVFNILGDTLYGDYTTPDVKFFISTTHELSQTSSSEDIIIANEMYADSWSFSSSSMTVDISLRDYSKYLQEKTLPSYVGQGINAGRAIAEMMMISGFSRRKISYIDRYEDEIFKDDPYCFIPFNFTSYELLMGIGGSLRTVDECQRAYLTEVFLMEFAVGQNLVYSETISTQDNIKRQIDQGLVSTFEPVYTNGSYKPALGLLFNISDDQVFSPFGAQQSSWTTEMIHYVDSTSPAHSSTYYTLMSNGIDSDYHLSYLLTDTEVKYRWKFKGTSVHYIDSIWLPRNQPNNIVVRKTGGSSNLYELFVNGIFQSSMSSPDTINIAGNAGIEVSDDSSYISHFTLYQRALSDNRIKSHFISSAISIMPMYRYVYSADQTYWDAMLSIATADLGMFYIDEEGYFRYEYRDMLHQTLISRYQNSQYSFSDSTNIISGDYISEIQTNKVIVAVSSSSVKFNEYDVLWQAQTSESLAVTTLNQSMSLYDTSALSTSTTDPYWPDSGYIKIDDEIMKYTSIKDKYFYGLKRGLFGTEISLHSATAKIREAKNYNATYSTIPAVAVKYPLLTNKNIDIDYYASNSYKTDIIVSLNSSTESGRIYMINGKDPVTDIEDFFEIVGIALSASTSQELVTSIDNEIKSNVRKYGVKELKIENPYIQNKTYAKIVGDHVIGYYKDPVRVLEVETLAVPNLQLGDLVTITNFTDLGLENKKFWVINNSLGYDGTLTQKLSLLSYSDTIDPPEFTFASVFSIHQESYGILESMPLIRGN